MSEETYRHLRTTIEEDQDIIQGRFIITVIGIDDYDNWPKLHNAVNDANGIEALFTEKFGFLNPIPPLLNEAATEDAILELVQDKLPTILEPDDNLILFFAGHGHTRVSQVGEDTIETGYIVPVEARIDRWSDYIKIGGLLEDIGQLPARHILLVLDACHSGFALGDAMEVHRSSVRYEHDLVQRRSRKVITSARREQPAVDSGPLPGHSLFTGTIIDGFNWGKVDIDGNGLITSFELGLFLQQQVGQASDARQTPDFGSFNLDRRGEMIISLGEDNFDAVKARAFTALRYRDFATFERLVEQLTILKPNSPEVVYLQFRLNQALGRVTQAVEKLSALETMNIASGAIPLSAQDVRDLGVQLVFWEKIHQIQHGPMPIEFTLLNGPNINELTEVDGTLSADGVRYQIPNDSVVQYKVKNLSEDLAFLYFIAFHDNGTMRLGSLLASTRHSYNGLAPGAEASGHPFFVNRQAGVHETRIFYSPDLIEPMLQPPTTASRAVMRILEHPVDNVRMKRVLHDVTAPTLSSFTNH